MQIRVVVNANSTTNQNAKITEIDLRTSTTVVTDKYRNLDTALAANSTSNPPGYTKIGTGKFRVQHRNGADQIDDVFVNFKPRTSTEARRAEIRTDNVTGLPTGTPPTAEIWLYNSSNQLADGLINITLEGPAG